MANYDKIHVGCGTKHIPGWFHVDALDLPNVDHVGRVENLDFIPDNTAQFVYACHVLEHFGRKTFKDALSEWNRVLKPGGVLRLAVPDFEAAATLYKSGVLPNGIIDVMGLVSGGQRDQYDFHGVIFDEPFLSAALKEVGFSSVARYDWRTTEHAAMDDYSQAYFPHMDKENGTLVSLNLEAVK